MIQAEWLQANWVLLIIALVIAILVALWLFTRSRRTKVEIEPRDDDAEATRPRRNQALIDAPPAATGRPPLSDPIAPRAAAPVDAAGDLARTERTIPPAPPATLARTSDTAPLAPEPQAPAPAPAQTLAPAPIPADSSEQQTPEERAAEATPPSTAAAPAPSSPTIAAQTGADSDADDLTRIKGLGPKLKAQLQELGVTSIAQIAAWDDAEIDRIDAQLGRFQGRIRRDDWPAQARLLTSGDTAAYEAKFGKL